MLKHVVIFFAILFCLLSARAQTSADEILLTSKAGCKLYQPVNDIAISAQLRSVATSARCVGGYYEGAMVYGAGVVTALPGRANSEALSARAGLMQGGRFSGLRLFFVHSGGGMLRTDSKILRSFNKFIPQYQLQTELDAIAQEAPHTGDKNYLANAEFLSAVLRAWDQDPNAMLKEYTDDISNPMVARATKADTPLASPVPSAQTSPLSDDPKVFGRSVRGG
jgi:hypothetical protein